MLRTWLPADTFIASATLLHDNEVYRIRQHVLFILNVLAGRHQHMRHSPHVVMWRGAELQLVAYGTTMCREWRQRGHDDKLEAQIYAFGEEALRIGTLTPQLNGNKPWWLGNEGFHLSHRSGLVKINPEYYKTLWKDVSPDLPMVSPDPTGPGGVRMK